MTDDVVVCEICNKSMQQVHPLHLRHVHNMTLNEYKEAFPDSSISSKSMLQNRSKGLKGKKRSEETKQRLSEANKRSWEKNPKQGRAGKKWDEKHKEAISQRLVGHDVSSETRQKISETLKETYDRKLQLEGIAISRLKKIIKWIEINNGRHPSAKSSDPEESKFGSWIRNKKRAKYRERDDLRWFPELDVIAAEYGYPNLF